MKNPFKRKTLPWRAELFQGLPTALQSTVDAQIEAAIAARVAVLEPMPPSEDEVKAFVRVMTANAMPGVYLFTWKKIPCCKVQRIGPRIIVSEIRG